MELEKIYFRGMSLATYNNKQIERFPILFVHGNSMSSKIWERQFNSFLSERYYLLALDLPGCGLSEHSKNIENDYNLSDLGDSILEVIHHYKLENFIIVGYSLGGNVVMQNIKKFKGCLGIFINSVPITLPLELNKMYLPNPDLAIMFQKEYTEDALDRIFESYFVNPSSIPSFLKTEFKETDCTLRQAVMNNILEGKLINEVATLNEINLPVAFVSGELEKVIDNTYFNTFTVDSSWHKSLQLIPLSSHCPQWERPDIYNNLLNKFAIDCLNQSI